jgi:hypothetical protein
VVEATEAIGEERIVVGMPSESVDDTDACCVPEPAPLSITLLVGCADSTFKAGVGVGKGVGVGTGGVDAACVAASAFTWLVVTGDASAAICVAGGINAAGADVVAATAAAAISANIVGVADAASEAPAALGTAVHRFPLIEVIENPAGRVDMMKIKKTTPVVCPKRLNHTDNKEWKGTQAGQNAAANMFMMSSR